MEIIEVTNLEKVFSYYIKDVGLKNSIKNLFERTKLFKEAVSKISFHVEEGEIVGFLGPNGAGKTTTLKMLSGILYPTGGNASVMGYIPWERKKDFKMQFSIVMGQKSQLWWDLPANESLFLNKYIYEIDDREYKNTLAQLTELLNVKDLLGIQVRRLSLGERMKLELIASLIHKPKVIFLDEPTIGLDIISQKRIRDFLKYYNQQTKTTIILTSHYTKDIEDLCKRVIVINKGKVIYDDKLNKINELLTSKKIIKLQVSNLIEKSLLEEYGYVSEFDGFNAKIEVDKQNISHYSKKILENLSILDLNIEDTPIEEGISFLYKKGGDNNDVSKEVC